MERALDLALLADAHLVVPCTTFILGIVFIDSIYDQPALEVKARKAYYFNNHKIVGLPRAYLKAIQFASLGIYGGFLGGFIARMVRGEYKGDEKRGVLHALGLAIALLGASKYTELFLPATIKLTSTSTAEPVEGDVERLGRMATGHKWVTASLMAILLAKVGLAVTRV